VGKQSLKIIWTDPAKRDLKGIFDYLEKISLRIAENQIIRIVNRVSLLEDGFSKIGRKEMLLQTFGNEYRYLVQDNYKIIYHQVEEKIVIDMVFDTRRDPAKMKDKL
jgi:plasmid stabilization system protein ParE